MPLARSVCRYADFRIQLVLDMVAEIFEDGLFAAIAAIGFSSISNTPVRAYGACAVVAAVGHAIRYVLMTVMGFHIIPASSIAAFAVGLLSVFIAPRIKCPAEVCFFPALLPMIPGMYAYRTVEALLSCLIHSCEQTFLHYFYLFAYNGFTCSFIIIGMVLSANIPVFLWKKVSFRATR